MYYNYIYIDYRIIKFHEHLSLLFHNLFSHRGKRFNEILIPDDLLEIFKEYDEDLLKPIKKIYRRFHSITDQKEKGKIFRALTVNNRIKELCEKKLKPLKYKELSDQVLAKALKDFFDFIYSALPYRKKFQDKYGNLKEQFEEFRKTNHKYNICPFCGIHDLKSWEDKTRDDNDHYLPKKYYPFNSMNFENLAPMCKECNQDYKKQKDTIFLSGTRNRAFYPFSTEVCNIELKAKRVTQIKDTIDNSVWEFSFDHNKVYDEEVKAWDDIFNIKSRYDKYTRKKLKQWMGFFVDRYNRKKGELTLTEIIKEFLGDLEFDPYLDQAFIKKAVFDQIFQIHNLEMKLDEWNRTN